MYCDEHKTKRKHTFEHVKNFRIKIKERAVEYLGGKCSICGYNKCIKALHFHHIDPHTKEFTISQNTNKAWEKVKKEIEKCILLCANCHAELHAELDLQASLKKQLSTAKSD
jgi:hypothetical protein